MYKSIKSWQLYYRVSTNPKQQLKLIKMRTINETKTKNVVMWIYWDFIQTEKKLDIKGVLKENSV